MQPVAMERGAEKETCQINRNEISRPHFCGPYISRKYRYDPPDAGSAAPNSADTSPSHTASSAPAIHPSSACGPPIALTTNGMVMNGPTPIMSIMFSAVADHSPIPRMRLGDDASGFEGEPMNGWKKTQKKQLTPDH